MEFGSSALLIALMKLLGARSSLWFREMPLPPPMRQSDAVHAHITILDGFEGPYGLRVMKDGTLYVANTLRGHLVRFSPTLEREGIVGNADIQEFPHAIAKDALGRLLVPDHRNGWIKRYVADGTLIDTFPITDAAPEIVFIGPVHVYINGAGTIFVTDYTAHRVLRFLADGSFAGWIGERSDGSRTNGWTMTGTARESAAPGGFHQPHMVAEDREGDLYIADTGNHRIQKFSSNGKFLGWTGGLENGAVTKAFMKNRSSIMGTSLGMFNRPTAVTFARGKSAAEDFLIIADTENERLQKIALNGRALGWMGGVAGGGTTEGWALEGEARKGSEPGSFWNPFYAQLFHGKLYVADTGNKRVQIIPVRE